MNTSTTSKIQKSKGWFEGKIFSKNVKSHFKSRLKAEPHVFFIRTFLAFFIHKLIFAKYLSEIPSTLKYKKALFLLVAKDT